MEDLFSLGVCDEVMGPFGTERFQGSHSNRLWELRGLPRVSMVTIIVILSQSAAQGWDGMGWGSVGSNIVHCCGSAVYNPVEQSFQ